MTLYVREDDSVEYVNDGRSQRFVAQDRDDPTKIYYAMQGGLVGDLVDYVRVDETMNVTVHEVTQVHGNRSVSFDPSPLNIHVVPS